MRSFLLPLAALALGCTSLPVLAADPVAAPPAAGDAKPADPVVAHVGDHDVHLSDVKAASASLPAELRRVPLPMLYPMLLGQAVDREALTIQARKQGLQNDPKVQDAMKRAEAEVLQNALLSREVGPGISEDAIRARYDRDDKDKPGVPELHARHILVKTQAEAEKIIAQLKKGAKFEDLAKKLSTDPGAQNGGDLGWFKRGDMVPAFSDAAFAMKPGEVSKMPVHTQFGWHVIQVEGTRTAPPQSFEAMHDQIRQTLISEGVKKAVADARQGLKIEEFMPDGTKLPAETSAVSAPGLPKTAGAAPGQPADQSPAAAPANPAKPKP